MVKTYEQAALVRKKRSVLSRYERMRARHACWKLPVILVLLWLLSQKEGHSLGWIEGVTNLLVRAL